MLTRARQLSLSSIRRIQCTQSNPISFRFITISSSHLPLDIPSGLFPLYFRTKPLYGCFLSPIHATCFADLILHDFVTQMISVEEYKSWSSPLCNFLRSAVFSPLLSPRPLLKLKTFLSRQRANNNSHSYLYKRPVVRRILTENGKCTNKF